MKAKTILTFIIFAAIFYALLAFNVFHIGEKLVPVEKDYVEITIPQEDQELEQTYLDFDIDAISQDETGHFAGNTEIFLKNLCNSINICEKIIFNGEFLAREKYNYTKIISKIIQFIDTNGTQDKKIKEVVSTIEINKDTGKRRGYATRNTIVFNLGAVKSQKEFIDLSAHEMGHITDLGYIQGTTYKKDKKFTEFGKSVFSIDDISIKFYELSRISETIRKAEAKKKDFCSGYGMSDPFEDFSECFNLYTNHNSLFKQIAKTNITLKKKYNFIASVFDGQYINTNSKDLLLVKSNASRRPRDTTKLNN